MHHIIARSLISHRLLFTPTTIKHQNINRCLKTGSVHRLRSESFVRRLNKSIANIERGQSSTGRILMGLGHSVASGVAVLGIGGFCHLILGMGKLKPIEYNQLPREVQKKLESTYLHFTGALTFCACIGKLSMQFLMKNPGVLAAVSHNGITFVACAFATQFIIGTVASGVDYVEGFGLKQFLFACQSGIMGIAIAPLILLTGFSMRRAGFVTGGLVGGLTLLGINTDADSLKGWYRPLSVCTNVIMIAFIGYMLGGRTSAYGNILYRTFLHGGVGVFSALFLYNSSNIVHHSKVYITSYDPINESMRIFMDTVNIFGRLIFMI